ncbi:MAG: hypothetical protein M1834_003843 [Cirrosporium novae-zelandiae]|nr:MAG: hypothetical protein M1834_003843 [Cirrosporium novae-zelandiae]
MPTFEVPNPSSSTPTLNISSLKPHKGLPKKRQISPTTRPYHLTHLHDTSDLRGQFINGQSEQNGFVRGPIAKSSTESTRTTETARILPPTPPRLPPEGSDTLSGATLDGGYDSLVESKQQPEPATPVNQRSPLTPDITPPEEAGRAQVKLKPPKPIYSGSSRTTSFETARESPLGSDDGRQNQQSEDDGEIDDGKGWQDLITSTSENLKFRLGPSSDDANRTPTKQRSWSNTNLHSDRNRFLALDGPQDKRIDESQNGASVQDFRVRPTRRRNKPVQRSPLSAQMSPSTDTTYPSEESSPGHSIRLRHRLDKLRNNTATPSTEKFAENINWPPSVDGFSLDERVNKWRMSGISTTSSTVEAIVVETLPPKQRTLRHTAKHPSLRALSSPLNNNRDSWCSSVDGISPSLHRKARMLDMGKRLSMASSASINLHLAHSPPTTIPVVVIPERRSSLKSSSSSSGPSRAVSNSSYHSARPATAPDKSLGYFDLTHRRGRTFSDSQPSNSSTRESIRSRNVQPHIPARSSSLSAPTSRNPSRAASLTSVTVPPKVAQEENQNPPRIEIERSKTEKHSGTQVAQDSRGLIVFSKRDSRDSTNLSKDGSRDSSTQDEHHIGDWASLRPQDDNYTPFSQHSIQSSSPGTIEISEATAITIYPHQNRSLLVIQQSPRRISDGSDYFDAVSRYSEPSRNSESGPVLTVPGVPSTPPPQTKPVAEVDSPLKNPREPPQPPQLPQRPQTPRTPQLPQLPQPSLPPSVKIIPPTPMETTPMDEPDCQLGLPSENSRRPMALLRRLSSRRRSESLIPFLRASTMRRVQAKRRPSVEEYSDERLHPFWRPASFWNDLETSDSESDSDFDDDVVNNSLGFSSRRALSNPRYLIRSISRRATGRDGGIRRQRSYSSMGSSSRSERGRLYSLPQKLQIPKLRAIQQKFENVRERRHEEKQEARRQRIRQSIGHRIVHDNAML